MVGKDDLAATMTLECEVAQHLFAQLPRADWPATLAWRPTSTQRSTLELLRYLSYCGIGACRVALEGSWTAWKQLGECAEQMQADAFVAAMDSQKLEIVRVLENVSEAELVTRKVKDPRGQELTLGRALLDMPIRWLVAYRMQLFLYARSLGADVWTPDCWYGVSMPRPASRS